MARSQATAELPATQQAPSMIIATARIVGVSPYSQSRMVQIEKLKDESAQAHEERTWWSRVHRTEDGHVYIPPMALKNALDSAAAFRSEKIQGENRKTWTKEIERGVFCVKEALLYARSGEPIILTTKPFVGESRYLVPDKLINLERETLSVNPRGQRGGSERVPRTFPLVLPGWSAEAEFTIFNTKIPKDIFQRFLAVAGKFIGLGRFRPENRGFYGRFIVETFDWVPMFD